MGFDKSLKKYHFEKKKRKNLRNIKNGIYFLKFMGFNQIIY
jgi:hypothetical protein